MTSARAVFSASLLVFLLASACLADAPARPFQQERHKGVCYAAWSHPRAWTDADSDAILARLRDLGANWIALRVTWFQDRFDSPVIRPMPQTQDDDSVRHAVRTIHSLGMKAKVELVVDLLDATGTEASPGTKWRGMIAFPTEEAWQQWFRAYGDFVLHYAKLCEASGADMLCMGMELTNAATTHEQAWRDLIAKCREHYGGPLTYQANWSPLSYSMDTATQLAEAGQWPAEYRAVKFWDALDYATVCGYFPLGSSPRPSLEELEAAWEPWRHDLTVWAEAIGKPVLFGEVGYHSCQGATSQPWTHRMSATVDLDLQRDCYLAFLRTFWEEPWFGGVYWWLATTPRETGVDDGRTGFPFLGKPAEDIVREYYGDTDTRARAADGL